MNRIVHGVLAMAVAGLSIGALVQPGSPATPKKTITFSELQGADVIGRLGVTLGTCVSIRGVAVSGDSLRAKGASGRYLLRVLEVDGRAIREPELFDYSCAPGYSGMPTDHFDHFRLIHGEPAHKLNGEQMAALEKDFVGTERRLIVFEVGWFVGMPSNLPEGVVPWQSNGFDFRTSLEIVADNADRPKR